MEKDEGIKEWAQTPFGTFFAIDKRTEYSYYTSLKDKERLSGSSVAQLVEHPAVNRRVVGSSPTWGARFIFESLEQASQKAFCKWEL